MKHIDVYKVFSWERTSVSMSWISRFRDYSDGGYVESKADSRSILVISSMLVEILLLQEVRNRLW